MSLHGARAETHDRQTRVPGSFERLLANLNAMKDRGLRFKLNTTLTLWNENEIEGMFQIARDLEAPLAVDPEVTPRDNRDPAPLAISASAEGLRRLFELQAARAEEAEVERQGDALAPSFVSSKHCGAGSSGIAVDPFGNVYPCVQWRRPVGNLHRSSIREIWAENGELEAIRELTAEAKRTVSSRGAIGKFLNFCPGSAEMRTGSPLRVPESSLNRARLFYELKTNQERLLPLHPLQPPINPP